MFRSGARITAAALVATALASASAFAEESGRRWYGSLAALHDMPSDSAARFDHPSGSLSGDILLSGNPAFAFALGFELATGLGLELEAAARTSDIKGASGVRLNGVPVPGSVTLDGDLRTLSLMLNVRRAFGEGRIRPYVGVGIGFARHDGEAALDFTSPLGAIAGRDSGRDTVPAYQAMVGIEGDPGEKITAFAGFRYLGGRDIEIEALAADYSTMSVDAGVRVEF